eukprot:scaffold25620_cov99-Isochrysis_galbana.AAC.8
MARGSHCSAYMWRARRMSGVWLGEVVAVKQRDGGARLCCHDELRRDPWLLPRPSFPVSSLD